MPASTDTTADWARLGHLLVDRRIRLDARYHNRRVFAAERGINWRTAFDVERAKRTNFEPETLIQIEAAYELQPGAVAAVLAGGELAVAPASREAALPGYGFVDMNDEAEVHLWRTPGLSVAEREAMVATLRALRSVQGGAAFEREYRRGKYSAT